jgi:hypothetical protein
MSVAPPHLAPKDVVGIEPGAAQGQENSRPDRLAAFTALA